MPHRVYRQEDGKSSENEHENSVRNQLHVNIRIVRPKSRPLGGIDKFIGFQPISPYENDYDEDSKDGQVLSHGRIDFQLGRRLDRLVLALDSSNFHLEEVSPAIHQEGNHTRKDQKADEPGLQKQIER